MTDPMQRRSRMLKVGIILVLVVIISNLVGSLSQTNPTLRIVLLDLSQGWRALDTLQSVLLIVVIIELLHEIVAGGGIRQLAPWAVAALLLSVTAVSWAPPLAAAAIILGGLWLPALTNKPGNGPERGGEAEL